MLKAAAGWAHCVSVTGTLLLILLWNPEIERRNLSQEFILKDKWKQLDSGIELGCQSALMEFSINLCPISLKRRQARYAD